MRPVLTVLLGAMLLLAAAPSVLAPPALAEDVTIGYLELKPDSRYGKKRTFARYLTQPLGRPYGGAEVALSEVKFHGAAVGAQFKLARTRGKNAKELLDQLDALAAEGVHFFLVDAPADVLAELAEATEGRDLLLFNITAREDRLRQEQCHAQVLHVIPSYAMLTDALAQYLVSRGWTDVLLLEGPLADDQALADAFERSATRFGASIVERRPFVLSNDPRERDQNNVRLLTTGDYDVVMVADTDGEFARDVPYQTVQPQLVVSSEGLAPAAWHWAWERHGAPQLENRFEKQEGRPMRSFDWAAWMSVKAIAEAVQRTASLDFATLRDHLLSEDLVLDGFKGNRLNFRPWDHQLRQPILLVTHNWVVARAPIEGFLHATNNMDTLGFDEADSRCKME
jgi:ABC transporter substrate binding protein (PQQ-dependent alcohol dehydrogenase system)